jgi:thiol-disulfide isomerase/thioredoxin
MHELIKNEPTNYFTEANLVEAFETAKQKQLPVLIDFWAPGCKGCKKMELTTYQDHNSLAYIDQNFVFVKYNITNRSIQKMVSTPILWTPSFLIFANDGSEVRKATGYLNPEQFKAELEIGRALAFLRKAQPHVALTFLENFIGTTNQFLIPEAIYWAGVSSYFLNKRNPASLIPYWEKLINDYPNSEWANKADCLNVIIE